MYGDYIRLVFKDLNRRKFSSFLTFFAISLGILSIFLIVLISQGFERSIQEQFEQFGSNRLYVTEVAGGFSGEAKGRLSDNEVNLVQNEPYVDEVYPYFVQNAQIRFGREFTNAQVLATTIGDDYFQALNLEIAQGRSPRPNEPSSLVIGPRAAEEFYEQDIQIGSSLYIKERKFQVVGITESVGNPQDDGAIYAPLDTVRDLYGAGDKIAILDVILVEGTDVNLAAENLERLLENRLGDDTVNVRTPEQLLSQLNQILGIVRATLGGIALISLLVGAFGIINTMYVIVTEKTKEIGIMKAIGARNEDILFLYVFQAGMFGLVGAAMGAVMGGVLAKAFEAFARQAGYGFLSIAINPLEVVLLLLFGFVIGVVSGYLPAKRASRLRIITALGK